MTAAAPPSWLTGFGIFFWVGALTLAAAAGLRLLGRGALARHWILAAGALTLVGAIAIVAYAVYDIGADGKDPAAADSKYNKTPPPALRGQERLAAQLLT